MQIPRSILIDARNFNKHELLTEIHRVQKVGFDIETHDADRHAGLNAFMEVNEEGHKRSNKPLVFDIRRTTVTGFSWYCEHSDTAYYLNLNHADEQNRIPWEDAKCIVDAIITRKMVVIHNAPFERTMMRECYGIELGKNVLCSMQLAVSAFNDDTYDIEEFNNRDLGNIKNLIPEIVRLYKDQNGKELNTEQEEILFKFIAKESTATHSYNGWVLQMAYRFGLKNLSKKFLGYEQTSFHEVLGGKAHMGELNGSEVVEYGADDAWVCLKLAGKLVDFLKDHSPDVLKTFLKQENPMSQIYSEVWSGGLRIDIKAVEKAKKHERKRFAQILRELKSTIKQLLPFPKEPHPKLLKYDKWYEADNGRTYRNKILRWLDFEDFENSLAQAKQVSSAISNAWTKELGLEKSSGVNLTHYMTVRTLLYDLCGFSYIQADGKTQSNGDAQNKMRERWIKKHGEGECPQLKLLDLMKELSSIEQIMKLYITNYLHLTDPETGKMYPVLNSLLNTRRMALSFPNVSQLPKFGYVRSFFQADNDDHLIVSCDWSGIELVIIGEQSQDKSFKEAYGQLPYADLHTKAAAGCMDISEDEFNKLPNKKELRRDIGKGANFGYWYSGGLGTVGQTMGWSSDEMWKKVEGYRETFEQAEAWRVGQIAIARKAGFVVLPDGHVRYRHEATDNWNTAMRNKFLKHVPDTWDYDTMGIHPLMKFADIALRKIRTRAGNQSVNAIVQGTGGTLAKRSILAMRELIKQKGYDARFMFPVHDELLYSCHKKDLLAFINDLKFTMCNHRDLFPTLILDATVAIGRNFGAYDAEENPYGQIELAEFNADIPGLEKKYQKLNDAEIQQVINYLTESK